MPLSLGSKLARTLVTAWLVISIVFFALRLSGDPLTVMLPDDAPPELIEYYRRAWGLDRSLPEQYLAFWQSLFAGDLGQSFVERRDALAAVLERVPQTLLLTGVSFVLALTLGLSAGIIAALRHNRALDRLVMAAAVSSHALPSFFLAILLILLFSVQLRWLPSSGRDGWQSLVMPALALGTSGAAVIARFTRSSVLDVLAQPHVLAARARGYSWPSIILRDVLPNAAIPIVTVIGFMVGGLIGGAVVTETVFAWPGVGRLLINSVGLRDFAVVQVVVLLIAMTMVAANLTVDLLYGWLDPRTRRRRRNG